MIRRVNASITLEINGESRSVQGVSTVKALIDHLALAEDRVAVEVNSRIVRRRDWDSVRLSEKDRVEIVQFVGGG